MNFQIKVKQFKDAFGGVNTYSYAIVVKVINISNVSWVEILPFSCVCASLHSPWQYPRR